MDSIYLHGINQFISLASISEKELKAELKHNFNVISRRTSRLTLLALLGVLPLKPTKHCGIYVASSFSSPSNMYELEMDVLQHKTPRPFNFINSINNAVSFYVAQALNVKGPNLFIATDVINWSQVFLPALTDLQLGIIDQALVGWCYEHRKHVDLSSTEGSHWLLLSKQRENAIAQLMIVDNDDNSQRSPDDSNYYYQSVIEFLERIKDKTIASPDIDLILNKKLQLKLL